MWLMPYTDLWPQCIPILYFYPHPCSVCPYIFIKNLQKGLISHKVSPHGIPSKHYYSPSGRLLSQLQCPTTNGPLLPPPTSFFNIQIGCFVRLNWRLIAHTIWRCLFKKTMAFIFFTVSRWLRLEIRHWRLLHTAFLWGFGEASWITL